MKQTLIRNGIVLDIAADGTSAEALPQQDVLIKGNRIDAIQPTGTVDPTHFDRVIEANGQLIMPGLINTHAHVPMVLFRGLVEDMPIDRWFNEGIWPLENNLEPEDVYWGTLLGMIEMLESGVTTVADHYFHMHHSVEAIEKIGGRALLGWAIFGSMGQQAIDDTADWVEEVNGSGTSRIRAWMAPHAPYTCDDDFLRATAKKAAQIGVGLHIHASETSAQTKASLSARGITPIQVLEETGVFDQPTILAHCCGVIESDIDIIAKHQKAVGGIAHAPKTYLKLGEDIAPIVAFREAGIAVGLATDGAASNNTMDLWEPLRLMPMLQKDRLGAEAMPIPQALHVATRSAAQVVGLADDLGAVEVGRLADLVLVDMRGIHHTPLHQVAASLVYNTRPNDVTTVLVDGEVVVENGRVTSIDRDEVISQAKARMERLSQNRPDQRIQTYNP